MKSFTFNISPVDSKYDLTIIYKEIGSGLHEIKTQKDQFLKSLRYFGRKKNEINEMKIVYIEEKIDFDIIKKFIESIENKVITISENENEIYKYLCDKYEYTELSEQMREFSNNRPDIVETIDSLSKKSNEMSYEKEEVIAKNLDFVLRSGNLKKLPLSVINRILNSPSRILKDHHLLHSFVVDTIKRYSSKSSDIKDEMDEENLLILPSSLDYAEMTNKELEELFEVEEKTKYFNPKNADTRIQRFLKDNQLLEERYLSFEEKIEQMMKNEKELAKKINMLEDAISKMKEKEENQIKKMNVLEDAIRKMKEKEENQIIKINVLESKLNDHILPKINKLDEYVEKSATKHVKLEEKINNIETLVQNQTNSIRKEFEEQKKSIKSNNLILQEQEKLQLSLKQIQNLLFIPTKIIECENGLFRYLFDKYKANPINIGIVDIKGNSSSFDKHIILPKLIDAKWTTNSWSSQKVKNSYIQIDFINSFIKINKYHLCVGWTEILNFMDH